MVSPIVHETTYPHPPAKVWRALTDPELIGQWLMKTDFQAKPGARYRMDAKPMPGWRGFVVGEVKEVVPERKLVYTWDGNGKGDTTVTWTLEPVDGGKATRVKLVHSGFRGWHGFVAKTAMKNGWRGKIMKEGLPGVVAQVR